MDVYKFKVAANSYGGGEIIVAANSKLEAYGVIAAQGSFITEYTSLNDCEQLTALTANVETPCVISSEYYIE